MNEYTPTTEEVLDGYRAMRAREIPGDRLSASMQAMEEATAWLSGVIREAKAEQREADARIAFVEGVEIVDHHPRHNPVATRIAAAIRAGGSE